MCVSLLIYNNIYFDIKIKIFYVSIIVNDA